MSVYTIGYSDILDGKNMFNEDSVPTVCLYMDIVHPINGHLSDFSTLNIQTHRIFKYRLKVYLFI